MSTDQFPMWGYQQQFRATAADAADQLFQSLDPSLRPRVFLVGIHVGELPQAPPVCVTPPDCGYSPEHFRSADERAGMVRDLHRARSLHYSDDCLGRRGGRRTQIGELTRLIRETVERQSPGRAKTFCSRLRIVDDYLVSVVLQLDARAYNEIPHLRRSTVQDICCVPVSLVQTAAERYAEVCVDQLGIHSPGAGDRTWPDAEEMLRVAGIRFMATAETTDQGPEGFHALFAACNAISSMKYEGEEKTGSLLVACSEHPALEVQVRFGTPVPLSDRRGSRKLLQMCSEQVSLLANPGTIYGLGCLRRGYDPGSEEVFEVAFTRHSTWEFRHQGVALMEVSYGQPRLPRPPFQPRRFQDALTRAIPGLDREVARELCGLAQEAACQRHGTMLAITPAASVEATRLGRQAMPIEPRRLTPETLRPLTEIDGAVLLDDQGVCHAAGVILDGMASENGTPSRGARYNSAIRFTDTLRQRGAGPCLTVIISEDGTIDFYPP